MALLHTLPAYDGFRPVAESYWHKGCWMIWPQRQDNWRMGAKPAQKTVCELAQIISRYEPVTVCVNADQYENARERLDPAVRVIELSSNEAFLRDSGPTFVISDTQIRGINWTFNGYGGTQEGLYFPWDADELIAQKICELEWLDYYQVQEFVLEGCAFRFDGESTVVVTEECLLSEGRNPHLTREQMESTLKCYLGVEKTIWLHRGLYMDEGRGHIDNLFCFIRPGEALLSWTDDPGHPQYEIVREALGILENETDAVGRKLVIYKMPLPHPLVITAEEASGIDRSRHTLPRQEGDMLVASYLNFYMPNGALICPKFGDPNDAEALKLFSQFYPNREIIGVNAREIFLSGGGFHSMVLQQPSIS